MNILEQIYKTKEREVKRRKLERTREELLAQANLPRRQFKQILIAKISQKQNAVIAELKKASPSKGVIRSDFNVENLAKSYQRGGATCLSVLTDHDYFMGQEKYLTVAKLATNLPLLRKDFMIDKYQIAESLFYGADAVLLIVAMLDRSRLEELYEEAVAIDLDILIEVHNEEEVKTALELVAASSDKGRHAIIGINNRDLKDFSVDINRSVKLMKLLSDYDVPIIAESGISSANDIAMLNRSAIYGFLIGESLMRVEDPAAGLMGLLRNGITSEVA